VSAAALRTAAKALCELDDVRLRKLVGVDPLTTEDALRWRCFDLTYAARLLTDGYGFDENAAVIDFLGEINGVEVEWTLGALLHQLLGMRSEISTRGDSSSTAPQTHRYRVAMAESSLTSASMVAMMLGAAVLMWVLHNWYCLTRNHTKASRSRLLSKC